MESLLPEREAIAVSVTGNHSAPISVCLLLSSAKELLCSQFVAPLTVTESGKERLCADARGD